MYNNSNCDNKSIYYNSNNINNNNHTTFSDFDTGRAFAYDDDAKAAVRCLDGQLVLPITRIGYMRSEAG